MSLAADTIVHSLSVSQHMIEWFCEDFSAEEWNHRPVPGSNSAAWIVGHLVLTDRHFMRKCGMDEDELPPLPEGFEARFEVTGDMAEQAEIPDPQSLIGLFNTHRELLIDRVRALGEDVLAREMEVPRPIFATEAESLNFAGHHTTMHAGQLTVIRRSLGRKPFV